MNDQDFFGVPVVASPREIDPVCILSHLKEGFSSLGEALKYGEEEYMLRPRSLEVVLMYNCRDQLEHVSFLVLSGNGRRVACYKNIDDRLYYLSTYKKTSESAPTSSGIGD